MASAFHAYDIRGEYNKDFDKEIVYKVGFFLPDLLKTDKVLVGRDVRESSPEIHEYLLKGITDAGANVTDIGLSTTPMVYYVTATKGFKASVQITASHNPAKDNGLKVSREGAMPVGFDTGLGSIKQWIDEGRELPMYYVSGEKGKVEEIDIKQEYIDFQKKYVGDYSGLKIGMDISNGMAGLLVKDLLGDAPIYIFDELDGRFPNHEANPLVAKNRVDIDNLVRREKCDIGVIFDGDADRVMFVDENSRFVSPDLVIAMMGHFFFEGKGTSQAAAERKAKIALGQKEIKVLQDIRSSKAVGEYLDPLGGDMNTWRVGRAFAAPKLKEIDGLFGGELAGHYYFKDFFYSDSGMMAALIVLDIVAEFHRQGVKVSELISKIEKYQNSGEMNFRIEKKKEAMDAVRAFFTSEDTPQKSMDFDGYREEFEDWWFNIRPSNTEPYLRFICEATSKELLEEKVTAAKAIIESC